MFKPLDICEFALKMLYGFCSCALFYNLKLICMLLFEQVSILLVTSLFHHLFCYQLLIKAFAGTLSEHLLPH